MLSVIYVKLYFEISNNIILSHFYFYIFLFHKTNNFSILNILQNIIQIKNSHKICIQILILDDTIWKRSCYYYFVHKEIKSCKFYDAKVTLYIKNVVVYNLYAFLKIQLLLILFYIYTFSIIYSFLYMY